MSWTQGEVSSYPRNEGMSPRATTSHEDARKAKEKALAGGYTPPSSDTISTYPPLYHAAESVSGMLDAARLCTALVVFLFQPVGRDNKGRKYFPLQFQPVLGYKRLLAGARS